MSDTTMFERTADALFDHYLFRSRAGAEDGYTIIGVDKYNRHLVEIRVRRGQMLSEIGVSPDEARAIAAELVAAADALDAAKDPI